jgi:purine/pyrimidine-nucleoside phosphorylase
MTTEKIDHASVTTQANVYFDGKCVSHNITLADGTKKSVGVVSSLLPHFQYRRA